MNEEQKSKNYDSFKKVLDESYSWPSHYLYKFIVPASTLETFLEMFPKDKCMLRPSRNGRYQSITFKNFHQNSDEVIQTYEQVRSIPGVIVL